MDSPRGIAVSSGYLNEIDSKAIAAFGALAGLLALQVALNSRLQAGLEDARSRQMAVSARKDGNGGLSGTPAPSARAAKEEGSRRDPRLFALASFGQVPAAIDWVWIQVLLDDRITHVPRGTHAAIFYDLDLISRVDPAFSDVYRSGADLLAIVRDDIGGARELLERGDAFRLDVLPSYPESYQLSYWSHPWQVPLYLAYLHLFELGDLPSAAGAFREAARVPGAPAYLPRLAEELALPGGQYRVGLRLLNLMIEGARDERSREELSRRRSSLQVAQFLDQANRDYAGFLDGRKRSRRAPAGARAFAEFLEATRPGGLDPWGGALSLDANGRIQTTTPHEKVFGLE